MPIGFGQRHFLPGPLRWLVPSPALWQRLAIATNWPVLASVTVLSLVGVLTIRAYDVGQGSRQLTYLAVAIVALLAFQAVNYQKIGRFAWLFYFLSFLPLGYTVLGSIVTVPLVANRNGAFNWIQIGSMSFQPSEVMKIAFIMALARYLRFRENYRSLAGLIPPFALCVAPVVLILKQPDLGTALVFGPTLIAMLFVAGAKLKHLGLVLGMVALMLPIGWFAGQPGTLLAHLPPLVKGYQRDRVLAMFHDDEKTRQGVGLQQLRALTAFGSGGITGKGLGQIDAGRIVPEAQNDMIFALVGEQFGLIGVLVVIVAYCTLFAAGVEISSGTREPFGRLVAVGLVAILAAQTFLNLSVVLKLMPVTGVTLPFISAGGSSLIASYMAAGLLLNIGQNRPIMIGRDAFEYDD